MAIRLLLIDRSENYASVLAAYLEYADFVIVGISTDAKEIEQFYERYLPDIVIMDASTVRPTYSGIPAIMEFLKKFPDAKLIGTTQFWNLDIRKQLIAAGARGYFIKSDAEEKLIEVIKLVAVGQTYHAKKLPF